ncbi:MAG: hypothetical protein EXS05_09365 [Planctomycetaceae bacterium]|nr:hypothetical protein [Planctomycetaceae bacterium]
MNEQPHGELLTTSTLLAQVFLNCQDPPKCALALPIAALHPARLDSATTLPSLPDSPAIARQPAIFQLSLSSWLLVAWIGGVLYFLARLLGQWWMVRTMLSRLADVTDRHALQSVVANCRQMRLRRQPELRVSNDSGSPCQIGIVRPVIVLPAVVLESCSAEVVDAAVIHELAHVKRRDLLWNWLPALAEVLYFFHPLVWLAKREWRLAQEIAADQLAVGAARVDVAQYAESLLELVAKCRTTRLHAHLVVSVSETYAQLSRRMIAMQTFRTLSARCRIAAALVVAVAVCGVAPWKLTNREAQARFPAAAEPAPAAADLERSEPPLKSVEAVIARIEGLGGDVVYDETRPGRPVISVSLFKTKVTDHDLRELNALTDLKVLTLDGTKVTDAGLAHLAEMTTLRALDINSTGITDKGLAHLKGLTRLEQLGLIETRVTDEGLVNLEGMTQLVMLLLSKTPITDEGLVHLKGLNRLATLMLDGTKITDEGLAHLQGLTSLRDLRLNDTRIGDAGLRRLTGLSHLQTLVLNSAPVTDAGLAQLIELPDLQTLLLTDTKITDAGLLHLGQMTSLQSLGLRQTEITDAGLAPLKRLKHLRTLDIAYARVTEEGAKNLQTELPGCKITWDARQKTIGEFVNEFSKAEYSWQQHEVARQIIAHGDKKIIPKMTKFLETTDRHRRCNAALVLAGLGDPRGLPALIGELKDKNPRPAVSGGRLRSNGTPDDEGQILEDRYYAATLLGQLKNREAVPALIEATTDKTIHYAAAISLGEIGDKSAIPALRKMAADFPDNKLWAGYGLAALGEQQGFDLLFEAALSDSRWTERRHAVEALGKIGDSKAVPTVIKALHDSHVNVRVSAATALGQIGDPAALDALTEALTDTEATQFHAPTTTARAAQTAIEAIKNKK